MSYERSQAEDLAWIVKEAERLARHVDAMRSRIVSNAARRVSSSTQAAVKDPQPAPPEPVEEPAPRASCLSEVSRWLPPPTPPPRVSRSRVRAKLREAGRYCFVSPDRGSTVER